MAWRTRHFELSEFTKSATAEKLGIDNTPTAQIVLNLCVLAAQVLEPVRQRLGVPFVITSGFRCPALNKAVGGKENSYHLTGCACDIRITSQKQGETIGKELINEPLCDLVLIEHKGSCLWLHVQFRYKDARHKFLKNYKA